MIKSMTGYGRCKKQIGGGDYSVEIKSVNSRFLDCAVKMSRAFLPLEDKLKRLASKHISRGKVEIFVSVEQSEGDRTKLQVNREYLEGYISALKEIQSDYGVAGSLEISTIAAKPEIFLARRADENLDELWENIKEVAETAFEVFSEMRRAEGEKLGEDIKQRLCLLEEIREKLLALSPEAVAESNQRMTARVKELLAGTPPDESRLLTECAIFADKSDVTEELVRLKAHFEQFGGMFNEKNPVGRKMDFLVQEINREINTAGSKMSDIAGARLVIEAKSELEKIREQIQNIE